MCWRGRRRYSFIIAVAALPSIEAFRKVIRGLMLQLTDQLFLAEARLQRKRTSLVILKVLTRVGLRVKLRLVVRPPVEKLEWVSFLSLEFRPDALMFTSMMSLGRTPI
jgi:hypothetical protein